MTWTTARPTKPGWYWWRSTNGETIGVWHFSINEFERMDRYGWNGEWSSEPLEPPIDNGAP